MAITSFHTEVDIRLTRLLAILIMLAGCSGGGGSSSSSSPPPPTVDTTTDAESDDDQMANDFQCGDPADTEGGSRVSVAYHDVGANFWPGFRDNLISVSSQPFDPDNVAFREVESIQGGNKYHGGVLTPGGEIFFIPSRASSIAYYNPETNAFGQFGEFSDLKNAWNGGVLGPDGLIYSLPWRDSEARLIVTDPISKTTRFIEATNLGYGGQILAPNGKIYGIPELANEVMVFDPASESISYIGEDEIRALGYPGRIQMYFGGVLAPNGSIYGIPLAAETIIKIDPDTDTVSFFGELQEGSRKWAGGVLTPDGIIVAVPDDATQILLIDTNDDSISFLDVPDYGNQKWSFGVFAPNGLVYMVPDDAPTFLTLDLATNTLNEFGDFPESDKWNGAVVGFNGKIYTVPDSDDRLLELDLCLETNFAVEVLLSTYFNKY